ncbi:hypothetical protein Acor_17370 [Acrocarpospora corrugata]|uniref:Integrase n=1 Tax=Acrocarpospora corrugata TaxID=35763 RepID=A0A5M3VT33_9ACTN|nr:hypothetical protein [Acrocarpospora corrugata]GER99673.1 hypothetical protein Acor_17370 [Acrocarpospora corrugata]
MTDTPSAYRQAQGCGLDETLGHTSTTFTRDTYTSVFPEVAKAAAESTAALLTPLRGTP